MLAVPVMLLVMGAASVAVVAAAVAPAAWSVSVATELVFWEVLGSCCCWCGVTLGQDGSPLALLFFRGGRGEEKGERMRWARGFPGCRQGTLLPHGAPEFRGGGCCCCWECRCCYYCCWVGVVREGWVGREVSWGFRWGFRWGRRDWCRWDWCRRDWRAVG